MSGPGTGTQSKGGIVFRMSETMLLFGLTAAQAFLLILYAGERLAIGTYLIVVVSIPLAFLASCIEMTLLVSVIHMARRRLRGPSEPPDSPP